ncbi:MAG: hypothetical protein GY816_22320, partial [Cytophagales bacterium]|nr:hypothetical protein [Cytophagales bacterium]
MGDEVFVNEEEQWETEINGTAKIDEFQYGDKLVAEGSYVVRSRHGNAT